MVIIIWLNFTTVGRTFGRFLQCNYRSKLNYDAVIVIASKDILELLKSVKGYNFHYSTQLPHKVVHKGISNQELVFANHYFL